MRRLLVALLAACSMLASASANALVFGYYLSGTTGSPAAAITAAGHTPQLLTGLSAADLATIDVLWILNGNNGTPDAQVTGNFGDVATFVRNGGVLSFHDRNVNQGVSAATYIPGAGAVTFVAEFGTEITVLANNTVTNGPAGVIGDTTLDGGDFSGHGYATLASLPAGAVPVLSTNDRTQIVDFYFPFGAGRVYYSTMPLDFYLAGFGVIPPADAYRNIYAVNEAAFQAQLRGAVPEPGSLALLGLAGGLSQRCGAGQRKPSAQRGRQDQSPSRSAARGCPFLEQARLPPPLRLDPLRRDRHYCSVASVPRSATSTTAFPLADDCAYSPYCRPAIAAPSAAIARSTPSSVASGRPPISAPTRRL